MGKSKNKELGQFLSGANPFLFEELCSAVSDYYTDFCNTIDGHTITIENSYTIAKNYIDQLNINAVTDAFEKTTETEWISAARKYFSNPHKGDNFEK